MLPNELSHTSVVYSALLIVRNKFMMYIMERQYNHGTSMVRVTDHGEFFFFFLSKQLLIVRNKCVMYIMERI